jgi:hypothetical protein
VKTYQTTKCAVEHIQRTHHGITYTIQDETQRTALLGDGLV